MMLKPSLHGSNGLGGSYRRLRAQQELADGRAALAMFENADTIGFNDLLHVIKPYRSIGGGSIPKQRQRPQQLEGRLAILRRIKRLRHLLGPRNHAPPPAQGRRRAWFLA